ncbi:MAG: hypothetical protein M3R24_31925, partial [Chloroflexota bacterium]|nr:hypothetical protein [Chloroflexota bacterium]
RVRQHAYAGIKRLYLWGIKLTERMGHGSALRSQAETVRAILLPRERIDIARIVRFRLLLHIPSLDTEQVHVCH